MVTEKGIVSIRWGRIFSRREKLFEDLQSAIDFLQAHPDIEQVDVTMTLFSGGKREKDQNIKGDREAIIKCLEKTMESRRDHR